MLFHVLTRLTLLQFQSFSERIANVRIDVSHRVGHTTDSPEVLNINIQVLPILCDLDLMLYAGS